MIQNVFGQPVIGDAHRRHATGAGQCFKNCDRVAHQPEMVGRCQTGRAGPDNGDLVFFLLAGYAQSRGASLQVRIRCCPFEQADGEGFIPFVAHAGALTGMGAGASDHTGQDAFFPYHIEGLAKAVVSDQFDIAGDIQTGRAGLHAGGGDGNVIGFLSGRSFAVHRGGQIHPVIFNGIQDRRQGGGAAEIALAVQSHSPGNVFNLLEVFLASTACRQRRYDIDNLIDADHADGAFTAGQLSGLLEIGQGQGQDIRLGVRHDHAVPPHQGIDLLAVNLDRDF